MKYTISDENRWTTLAACVEHHVFYGYAPSGLPHRLFNDNHVAPDDITTRNAMLFMKELRRQMYGLHSKNRL